MKTIARATAGTQQRAWQLAGSVALVLSALGSACFSGLDVAIEPEAGADGGARSDADAESPDAANADGSSPDADATTSRDASADSSASGDGSFTPSNLAGLLLWLDPNTLVGDAGGDADIAFDTWTDTAQGIVLWQGVSTGAGEGPSPNPVTLATFANDAGSYRAVSFVPDGTSPNNAYLSGEVGMRLDFGESDITLETVVAVTAQQVTNGPGMIYVKAQYGESPFNGLQLFANVAAPVATGEPCGGLNANTMLTSGVSVPSDGSFHLFGFQRVGATLYLRYDGAAVVTATSVPATVDNIYPLYLGGRPDDNSPFLGFIGDVVLVEGTMSSGDLGSLETYLKTKYQIP